MGPNAGHSRAHGRPRATRRVLVGLVASLALAAGAMDAFAQSDVERRQAEVQRIEAELAGIDARVEDAANAYNGARYRLGEIQEDIRANQRTLNATERALARARVRLAGRLRDLYVAPTPSMTEVLLTSGSLTEVTDRMDLLEQVGRKDGQVVRTIRVNRIRLARARTQLRRDRAGAEREVAAAEAERRVVMGLLSQRQAVLSQAKGELATALEAQRQRRAREAQAQERQALERQSAAPGGAPAASTSGAPSGPAPVVPAGAGNSEAARLALQFLGVPYRWGGASPSGFDCSGLCSYVYGKLGKSVPHYTGAIWNAFPKVPRDQLQAGDMVFFRGLGHMGIYIGGNQMVHAPSTGDVVKVSSMSDRSDYVGAVRPP